MIKIFNANDKEFSSAGNIIIEPIKCNEIKKKSLNDWYIDVEVSIKYKEHISKDKLCVVKTKSKLNPQAFRVGEEIEYSTRRIKFKAKHVMFDAKDYALLDVRPTNQNGLNALNYINQRTDIISPFTMHSNVENVNTAYFIRKNLLEAWAIIEERWGGVFDADNWDISFFTSVGNDNGETIAYGKNMQGFDIFEDWSSVCTKLYPVGYDGLMLPEEYISSDVEYEKPYTRIIDFQTDLEGEEQTEENLLQELRIKAEEYLEKNKTPKVSYTIISNINNSLEIGDTIKVLHPFVNIFTEVLEYEYNLIAKKVVSLTFGNYSRDVKTKFNNIKNTIEQINQVVSKQEVVINNQTNLINSLNKNGYVYIDENEILILDTIPKEKAKNVWKFGLGGIGFSSNGYEGPFEVAMTMDGQINANFITTGTLSVSRIEGLANFISETEKQISNIEIEQGKITSRVESIVDTKGESEGKNIHIEDSAEEPLVDISLHGESIQEGEPTLNNPIEIENVEVKNKFSGFIKGIRLNSSNGIEYDSETGAVSDYIPVNFNKNSNYYLSGLSNQLFSFIAAYNANKEFLGRTGGIARNDLQINKSIFTSGTVQGTGDIAYIRITQYENDTVTGTIDEIDDLKIQIEKGTVATPYIPYNSLEVKVEGKNLNSGLRYGYYNQSDGIYVYNENYSCSKTPIYIKDNYNYVFLREDGSTIHGYVYEYDKGKNYLRRIYIESTGIYIPSNDACCFNYAFLDGTINSVPLDFKAQIELGTTVTDYEPYKSQTAYFPLAEGQKLMEGSYLADDGVHNTRKQVVLPEITGFNTVTLWGVDCQFAQFQFADMKYGVRDYNFCCNKVKPANEVYSKYSGYTVAGRFVVLTDLDETVESFNNNIAGAILEYELAEEELVPFTEEQQEAWNKIKALTTYKNITNITSDAYVKIVYMRDNGLDVYETKQNADKRYTETTEKFAETKITTDSIKDTVSTTQTTVANNYQELKGKFDDYAPKSDIITIQNSVEKIQTDTYTKTEINTKLTDGSVTKVLTKAGTFDENGLTIEENDAKVKSNLDHVGMKIMDATSGSDEDLMFAGYDEELNETIVRSKNMTVEKYFVECNIARREEYSNPILGGKGVGVFIL